MSVRINLEIGHEASIRNKRTHDGFTHDWEVFVRGCDNAEIHYYVEKVVFYLHETFPRPKRVVREPPYTVKESGYAGFNFPIEIYLRNSGEPKKIKFNYDLQLQQTGPAIIKVQKEKYVFNAVNDDFKHKLLKGGGMIVSGHENVDRVQTAEEKKELLNKPKLSGSTIKKHKAKPDEPYSFQYFGTPITKTSKVATESKPIAKDVNKMSNSKSEKDKEKSKSKHSPNKEKEKERDKEKSKGDVEKEKKNRDEKKKDKDRSKEREKSKEKSSKRDKSPTRVRSPSPKKSSPKRPPSPQPIKHREKDEKKIEKEKAEQRKSEEKFDKKSKKEKREHKDNNKHKDKDVKIDHKEHSKTNKETNKPIGSPPKVDKKEKTKENSDVKEIDLTVEKDSKEKTKSEDKPKHKHKKKDKERKEKKEEKKEKKPEKNSLFDSPKHEQKITKPLNTLISSMADDSSNNSLSSTDNLFSEFEVKKDPPPAPVENKKPKTDIKKEKKRSKERKDEDKKRKRKSDQALEEEPPDKVKPETNSDDEECVEQPIKEEVDNKENKENPEDYMNILRDLQHKIMTLQDNTELQKVVQLIAETGRYEVSARTFDFDLCLLERSTVQQLQEFFASSS